MALNAYALERTTCAHEAHSFSPNYELTRNETKTTQRKNQGKMNEHNDQSSEFTNNKIKATATAMATATIAKPKRTSFHIF